MQANSLINALDWLIFSLTANGRLPSGTVDDAHTTGKVILVAGATVAVDHVKMGGGKWNSQPAEYGLVSYLS